MPMKTHLLTTQPYRILWIFGIVALSFMGGQYSVKTTDQRSSNTHLSQLIALISERYVDRISKPEIEQKAISALLEQLDPHSSYIKATEVARANEGLNGNFQGIGVEFIIFRDTVRILKCIPDGPSEGAGLKSGDCILEARNTGQPKQVLFGKNINEEHVFEALRGPEASNVELVVKRLENAKTETLMLARGEIPIPSISCAIAIKPNTGYIKIQRFGAQTHTEFKNAVNQLKQKGLISLIVDLRGNGGGYLNAATAIADELLPKDATIVYTEGAHQHKNQSVSNSGGCYETLPLYVLIDQESASASEILAGAIQDNDRGTIIGRRSFGKGLVQDQIELEDGSVIRLTVARYYTPTGRCIQRPYEPGKNSAYEQDALDRYTNGELFDTTNTSDKTKFIYTTPKGKRVYGGGGINPDIKIPLDTSRNKFENSIPYRDLQFVCSVYAQHKITVIAKQFKSESKFVSSYYPDETFKSYVSAYLKIKINWNTDLLNICKAYIGRILFSDQCYYAIVLKSDEMINKTLRLNP